MPIKIVRNDINKIERNVVVNAASTVFRDGGIK